MDSGYTIEAKLKTLANLSLYDLRQEWRRLYRQDPPARLSRDLMKRGVAYRWQEQARGGLSKADLRKLAKTVALIPMPISEPVHRPSKLARVSFESGKA